MNKATLFAVLLMLSPLSFAGDACKTIMCIAGPILGGSGGSECSSAINDYFDIRVYKHGDFSGSRTEKKRRSYLDSCSSDEQGPFKDSIQSKYGRTEWRPSGL